MLVVMWFTVHYVRVNAAAALTEVSVPRVHSSYRTVTIVYVSRSVGSAFTAVCVCLYALHDNATTSQAKHNKLAAYRLTMGRCSWVSKVTGEGQQLTRL